MSETLNLEKSLAFIREGFIADVKKCYDNVYHNLWEIQDLSTQGNDVKILFCYMEVLDRTFTRHAAFLLNNEIIDITFARIHIKRLSDGKPRDFTPRYIHLASLEIDEYIKMLVKEPVTSLDFTFRKQVASLTLQAQKLGYSLIG